jgi:hypothetical protein
MPPFAAPDDPQISASELWSRLQTFYEPTVFWGMGDGTDAVPAQLAAHVGEPGNHVQPMHILPHAYSGAMGMF